mgnify:CR=1 FL=1
MSDQNNEQTKQWFLGLGAMFQKREGWSHETFGPRDIAPKNKDFYRRALADSWEIENRDQLHSQLDWLYTSGQQDSYLGIRNQICCMKRDRVAALASEIAEGDKQRLRLGVVMQYQHALGEGGVLGFDAALLPGFEVGQGIGLANLGGFLGQRSRGGIRIGPHVQAICGRRVCCRRSSLLCQSWQGETGNVATEDLVALLDRENLNHGIDLDLMMQASAACEAALGRNLNSRVARAGAFAHMQAETV